MFRTIASIAAFLALTGAAQAQDNPIEDVIARQLQAFNDRDVQEAWQYASPMIKGMFGTPDNFGTMVRNGYPMVWDNSNVEFLELREFESRTWQEVLIRGPDGLAYLLDYQMVETPEGWQINGVQIIPAPDMGV